MNQTTILILAVVAIIVIGGVALWGSRKRHAAFQELADAEGWTYKKGRSRLLEWTSWVGHGYPFGEGKDRRAQGLLTGTINGREFWSFDYSFSTDKTDIHGKPERDDAGTVKTEESKFSVTAIDFAKRTPSLNVMPMNFLSRAMKGVMGGAVPIDDPAFSKAFTVESPDEEFAILVMQEPLRELLLDDGQDLTWRLAEGTMMNIIENKQRKVDEVKPRLEMLSKILDSFPEDLERFELRGPRQI